MRAIIRAMLAAALILALTSAATAQPVVSTHFLQMRLYPNAVTDDHFDIGALDDGFLGIWRCEDGPEKCAYRSMDGGRTFASTGRPFGPGASPFNGTPMGTDGEATAIALGFCPSEPARCVARSTDGGQTWTTTSLEVLFSHPERPVAAGGVWLIPFATVDDAGHFEASYVLRSSDDGATWQPTIAVPAPVGDFVRVAALASDGDGTWLLAFLNNNEGALSISRSTDDGFNWTAPVTVAFPGSLTWITGVDIVGLGADQFSMLLVSSTDPSLMAGNDVETFSARSLDAGQSWQDLRLVIDASPVKSRDRQGEEGGDPQILLQPGSSRLWAFWRQFGRPYAKGDPDIFYAFSEDQGLSWSRPAAYDARAASDREIETAMQFAIQADGGIAAMWASSQEFPSSASAVSVMTSYLDCPSVPDTACLRVGGTGKSSLRITNSIGIKDVLDWRWSSANVDVADFGDPSLSTPYLFCLYESTAGGERLLLEREAQHGDNFWKATPKGFRGKNGRVRSTPIDLLLLSANGATGKLRLRARGSALSPPALPIGTGGSVIAQLRNVESGRCWAGEYAEADLEIKDETMTAEEN